MKVKDDYCHVCGGKLSEHERYTAEKKTKANHGWCKYCFQDDQPEWINLAESRCHQWLNIGRKDYYEQFPGIDDEEIAKTRAVLAHILEIDVP